jgi:hypothetical protein
MQQGRGEELDVGMVESLWHTTKNQTNGYKDGLERGGGGGGGGRVGKGKCGGAGRAKKDEERETQHSTAQNTPLLLVLL